MLTRDDEHRYFWNKRRVPGVTEVIDGAGLVDKQWYTDEARRRGKYVHRACELLLEEDLYWDGLVPQYRPWIESFALFVEATRPKPVEVESLHYSQSYGYAGQLDWLLEIDGQLWLIDGKTGQVMPHTGIQTAAYEHLLAMPVPLRRAGLKLRNDGKQAMLVPLKDPHDWPDFVHCLGAFNARLRLKGGWDK